ncbi:arylamine N-acetyltransferase 1 [Lyophyllum atratum]|nr:arylamine N-acetyltransferase 1 [Lyophyllum atratum]
MPTDTGTLQDGQFIKQVPSPYTPTQIVQWLSRIGFPTSYSEDNLSRGAFPHTLENLGALARLHLVAFPFENTAMHYTADHSMDVSLQGAYRRLVVDRMGSYCYGQNGVFMNMLRGLGYRAYAGAARVNINTQENKGSPIFTSLSHMVIFVQPFEGSNQTYLVDVGFGSTGLVWPILLSDAGDNIVTGTTPSEKHRLRRDTHPSTSLDITGASSSRADYVWNLEVCHSKSGNADAPWQLLYSFSENECFPVDAENASFVVSKKPEGIFWHNVLCVKSAFLDDLDPSDDQAKAQAEAEYSRHPEEVAGTFMFRYVMMGREVRRNIGGSSVVIRNLGSDLERIRALGEIFGLDIPDEAQVHIKGRITSLDG